MIFEYFFVECLFLIMKNKLKIKIMITANEVIEFIENQIYCSFTSDGHIHLSDWEKDVIEQVFDNNKKRVWIFSGRKTGATSLCRWMHWLHVKDPKNYRLTTVIGNTKDYMERYIKHNPIILHSCKNDYTNKLGTNCFEVKSWRNWSNLDGDINDIMYDVTDFNIDTYKIIDLVDRDFVTICLPLKEKIHVEALNLIKDDDVVISTDEQLRF